MMKQNGFTLAEVLITLAIIGIVAALTLPTLMANITQRQYDTAATTFQRKFGEALKVMNTQGTLGGYNSTEEFVGELSKHIKILKTCPNTELTKCFPKEVTFNNNKVDISTITKAADLGQGEWLENTDIVGVQFANGVSALLAYNKACIGNQFDNDYITLTGNSVSKKEANVSLGVHDCLAILYDVNGNGKPNTDTISKKPKDLRNVNVYALGKSMCKGVEAGTVCKTEFIPDPLDCTDSTNKDYCGKYGNLSIVQFDLYFYCFKLLFK